MDHKKDFQWLAMEKLGDEAAKNVDWSAPRLLCIAGDFTRYDEHAVKQINRNIELLRYRRFGDDLLMIELVHAPKVAKSHSAPTIVSAIESRLASAQSDKYAAQRIAYRISNAPREVRDLYEAVSSFLTGLGDDVRVKEVKNYIAFKRIKNFACVEVYPQAKFVTAYLKLDPDRITIESEFTRDVRKVGHFGTGDLEVSMRNMKDFSRAQTLFAKAYEGG